MQLYYVVSKVKNFNFNDKKNNNVYIRWFVERNEAIAGLDYKDVIVDYEKNKQEDIEQGHDTFERAERSIREYFTEEEANQLKEYLDNYDGELFDVKETTVNETALPIEYNLMPLGHAQTSETSDFVNLYDILPFKVSGLFDLES